MFNKNKNKYKIPNNICLELNLQQSKNINFILKIYIKYIKLKAEFIKIKT